MKRNRKTSVPAMEVEVMLDLRCRAAGKANPGVPKPEAAARTPRVTRLMALAVKYQEMVDRGELRDYADIARLGYVSRARMTQILIWRIWPRISRSNCCFLPIPYPRNVGSGR